MIILDTNFLVYVMKYKIAHILEGHKSALAVPKPVMIELEELSNSAEKPKDREAAKLALLILDSWSVGVLEAEGNADNTILDLAVKHKAKVATMDKILTRRLEEAGIIVVKLMQKKKLSI